MTPGLLIGGRIVPVTGLTVVPPSLPPGDGPSWAHLSSGDYRVRTAPRGSLSWVRQIIVHSTGGRWPMPIAASPGSGGDGQRYADIWATDPAHSAAHLVVDSAGAVTCLADLQWTCAYHAEASNEWSVGIEMAQAKDGTVHQATIDATAALCEAICGALGIPFQFHAGAYTGSPLLRMEVSDNGHRQQLGGPDCVGIFGHRDNTSTRGRGDPGDAIYGALHARGAEALDYSVDEDLHVARRRQAALVARGEQLVVDGIVGQLSLAAAKRQGFGRWRDVA